MRDEPGLHEGPVCGINLEVERGGVTARPPSFRHTSGTLPVQVFPLSDGKAEMGHADIAMTMV
jgi:hypothetical protein